LAVAEPLDPELTPGQLSVPVDWARVFGRAAPVVVEIGCGGGRFIISQAEAHPEWDFVAIERAHDYFKLLKQRAVKRRLANLRVLRTDGGDLVTSCFADRSVTTCHVYFPDPWPKKRHHKRRLFTDSFCAHLRRTLAPGGTLCFATDHEDYFAEILPRLRAVLEVSEHPGPWEDAPRGRTNYEIKYLKEGRPIFRLVARRET
jgi:tRNA (guanine-N7-)-methyltransferase